MTLNDILALVNNTATPQIRVGETHRFNNIWLVVAENRIFCRQYSFGRKSWYTAFQEDPKGAIKCGDIIIPIEARIPEDLHQVNEKVNQAYVEKYDRRLNHYPEVAHEMTGKKFMERTMELTPMIG